MPPNPIYIVTYNNNALPGYLQTEDIPINATGYNVKVLNRDGGFMGEHGADFKEINLTFIVLSRLSVNSTGLQHLADCKQQWRDALAIAARAHGPAALYIGETDRFVNAIFAGSTAPLEAPTSRRITYSLKFIAEPFFQATSTSGTSQSISGDDTITYQPGASRRSYPIISTDSGITAITVTDAATGKFFSLSGVPGIPVDVDCGNLTVTSSGYNVIQYLASDPNFGMSYEGSDTDYFTVYTSGVSGSGTVFISIIPRYER